MWGADCNHAEGIYGTTEFTRRFLAEVPAEKVERGDLADEHALRIGRLPWSCSVSSKTGYGSGRHANSVR